MSLPISQALFRESLACLNIHTLDMCALAFSGGSDSLTLLHLLMQAQISADVRAIIVDHGLRPESKEQAHHAARVAEKLGATPVILTWEGGKPTSNIQAKARSKRYELIGDYCAAEEIKHVFLAHHLNDQVETFIMRLLRGSGVDGLGCMSPMSKSQNSSLAYVRPLLAFPKERLLATLEEACLAPWVVIDASNANKRFTRVRVRETVAQLERLGLKLERVHLAASHMSRAREALDGCVDVFFEQEVCFVPDTNMLSVNLCAWQGLSEEIQNRVILKALQLVGEKAYKPRLTSFNRLIHSVRERTLKKASLARCLVSLRGEKIFFCREKA